MEPLEEQFTSLKQHAIQTGANTVVKRGEPIRIRKEAASIAFVQSHTSIPIPKIHKIWTKDISDHTFGLMEMEKVAGMQLERAWPLMDLTARTTATAEFTGYIKQLRAIPQSEPSGWIGACDGSGMFDCRLSQKAVEPVGPFASEQEFNTYISRNLVKNGTDTYKEPILPVLAAYEHKIVFTHGDLSSLHIFVDVQSGHILGIIDWEMSGWMPEYWEYLKALYSWKHDDWWVAFVKESLDHFDKERGLDADLEPW